MRKVFMLLPILSSMSYLQAQTVGEAVRNTQQNTTGTARYNALSGAFGALGGDLSALNNNPAGSAIFTESVAAITASYDFYNNDTFYFNGSTKTDDADLNFNQLGSIFVLDSRRENSKWRKISIGFNYDRTANFDHRYVASGTSTNSIDAYFLGFAQGAQLGDLKTLNGENITSAYQNIGQDLGYGTQQAFLGFQGFIFEPVEDVDENTVYISGIGRGDFDQEYDLIATGYNGKVNINVATQYGENLYLGVNLNAHYIEYERSTVFFENNANTNSQVTDVEFRDNLNTLGNGYSFQLGGIYKAGANLRVGATYDSPTWYTFEEETTQALFTDGVNGRITVNPNVVNVFERYDLRTPSKFSGSLAYIFKKNGLLSFDYSYQDFSNIEYDANDVADFTEQNETIADQLQAVSSFKIGGEYHAAAWSFRGGYRYETSPYKDEFAQGDQSGFSVGLGYNFGPTRLDVSYARTTQESNPQLYTGEFRNTAFVDGVNNSITATLSFRL